MYIAPKVAPHPHQSLIESMQNLKAQRPTCHNLRLTLQYILSYPAVLSRLIAETTANTALLESMTASAYAHPNGFQKVVIFQSSGYKLRLHLWPGGVAGLGDTDPHGHRWNFASSVVLGEGISISEFTEGRVPESVSHDKFAYSHNSDGSLRLTPIKRKVNLAKINQYKVRRCDVYTTDTSVIHQVRPLGSGAVATLMLQSPNLTDQTIVYRSETRSGQSPVQMTTHDVSRSLDILAEAIWARG